MLQAPRGHLGAPDLPGHLAWAPVPCTRTTSNSSLVLSLSPNPCSPDPRRPPGLWSCCPPSPATLTASRRDNRKPSTRPRRTCFYLLRVGGTQHVEGREPPTPHPPPAQDWTPGGPHWVGVSSGDRESKPSSLGYTPAPSKQMCWPTPNTWPSPTLFWLCSRNWRKKTAARWL